jgi:hypothetical protein
MTNDHYIPVNHTKNVPSLSHPSRYEIRIKGLLDPHWDWLENLTVTHLETGETLLSGPINDQAALHGLLARIRDLNLTLIAVNRFDTLEYRKEE